MAPSAEVKVPAPALKVPPLPVSCVQTPPVCSPVIKLNKSTAVASLSQIVVVPSVPALGCALILTVAILTSSTQGAVPIILYSKVLVVAPGDGVKVPAPALNVPPLPVSCVHTPPPCSPVINKDKSIAAVLLSQTSVAPSAPALGCSLITTGVVATTGLQPGVAAIV